MSHSIHDQLLPALRELSMLVLRRIVAFTNICVGDRNNMTICDRPLVILTLGETGNQDIS